MLWLVSLILIPSSFSSVDVYSRIDCFPEPGASQALCQSRGCLWEEAPLNAPIGTPWCYYPRESGFKIYQQNSNYYQLVSGFNNAYGGNISPINVNVRQNGKTLRVIIGAYDRYVPPINIAQLPSVTEESLQFSGTNIPGTDFFAFKIIRKSTLTNIWDTTIGGLQFADKFIQIATFLPSMNIFGFGEHIHHKLKHDLSRYTVWPMFARDIAPDSGSAISTQNLYGVHPFYICVENDGKAHGVLILNSNAQEVALGPGPHLVYRTIGGQLDLAFFPGPTPEMVVEQYLAHIGTPFLPAYWALGFQLSRWGYKTLTDMQNIVRRVQTAGIPLDVPYADIDYMRHDEDFTEGNEWSDFPAYVDQLHNEGLHVILIFDPAIEVDYGSFKRAIDQEASFIEWATNAQVPKSIQDQYPMVKGTKVMLGNVWPERNTAFPDFLDPTNKTNQWWTSELKTFHEKLAFDGAWIDMNEPSNFNTDTYKSIKMRAETTHLSCPISGPDAEFDNPPYKTYAVYNRQGESLCSKTLCMLGKTARQSLNFYDTKNLYGWSETRATSQALKAVTGKRGVVISRSTFPSSGRFGGHWLGDNTARWEDLQTSVVGAMEFNFFGIPYVGSDICGFIGTTEEELCLRWHQMGAFHSFSRNHNINDQPPQDPAEWPSVALAAKIALNFRYRYLPYLYSLHYSASRFGGTVIRPLFFEFTEDSNTMDIDQQFMWGPAMMIAPAVQKGVTSVHAYFPSATWYSLVPESYASQMDIGFVDVPAKLNSLTPVYARGGYIIPRQAANSTTTASRLNPLELLITIGTNSSKGYLYWDAGDDLFDNIEVHKRHQWQFNFMIMETGAILNSTCTDCDPSISIPSLDVIEILGYSFYPDFTSFTLNGIKININVQISQYSPFSKRLTIATSNLVNLNSYRTGKGFVLAWKHTVR